jgi:hypothetical protein
MKNLLQKLRILFRLKNIEKMLDSQRENTEKEINIIHDENIQLESMYYHLLNNSNRQMKRKWKRIRRNIPQNQ